MYLLWLLLSVLCLLYAGIVYMVGSGTFSFLIWVAAAAFFGLAFFLSRKDRWKKLPGRLRALILVLIGTGAVTFLICQVLIFCHFSDRGEPDLDYLIVLGAQMRRSGPSVIFAYRLDAAYDYLKNNPDTVCIVSGGKGGNEIQSEGDGGRDYLIRKGIEPDRVLAETQALDTNQNIRYSFAMIEEREAEGADLSIGIVTNNFHLFRGLGLARRETDYAICGIAAYTTPLYLPNNLVRESFGILRDFLILPLCFRSSRRRP